MIFENNGHVKPFSKKDWILLGIGYAIAIPYFSYIFWSAIKSGWFGIVFLIAWIVPLGCLVVKILTSPYEPYVEPKVTQKEEELFDYSKMGATQ